MVEMQMRVDHIIDSPRIGIQPCEAGADLLARLEMDLEMFGKRTDTLVRIVAAVWWERRSSCRRRRYGSATAGAGTGRPGGWWRSRLNRLFEVLDDLLHDGVAVPIVQSQERAGGDVARPPRCRTGLTLPEATESTA